jgi:hypothetical protein
VPGGEPDASGPGTSGSSRAASKTSCGWLGEGP